MPLDVFYEIFKATNLIEKRNKAKEILVRNYRYKEFSYEFIDRIIIESYINPLFEVFKKNHINDYKEIFNLPNLKNILEEFENKLDEKLKNL